jgi:hypothetical protein
VRGVTALAVSACLAVITTACGATGHRVPKAGTVAVAVADCPLPPVPAGPAVGEPGVYRAGPLTLVLGQDLAQVSRDMFGASEGPGGYAQVSGARPVVLSVDPASRRRLGLQFTALSGYGRGLGAVRFPACTGRPRPRGGLRFAGMLALHAPGCVRLHVRAYGEPAAPLIIPVGNSLAGCPPSSGATRLPDASFPYLGVGCGVANRIGCDRVRIGVHLRRAAVLVTVQVEGRVIALSPPEDQGDDLWQGALLHAGLRHGPLAVRAVDGYWYGEPAVRPRVRVTAYFADGSAATHAGIGYLHAGYG